MLTLTKTFSEYGKLRYFLRQFHNHIDVMADTYPYCLMPNHFHLLIRIKPVDMLNQHLPGFKNLEGVSASKRKPIIDVNYLIECILYIHEFRKHPADWKSSSFHNFHIKRSGVLNSLFGDEEKYFEAHDKKIKSYENYEILKRYFLD